MMNNGWGGGYGPGMGIGGGILMLVFWVAIIAAIVLLVVWLTRHATGATVAGPSATLPGTETALDVLKKRYAKGEIDKAEFEEKKKDLSG